MASPSNAALMEEFGYSLCSRCNSEALTFSIDPEGVCSWCRVQEARDE